MCTCVNGASSSGSNVVSLWSALLRAEGEDDLPDIACATLRDLRSTLCSNGEKRERFRWVISAVIRKASGKATNRRQRPRSPIPTVSLFPHAVFHFTKMQACLRQSCIQQVLATSTIRVSAHTPQPYGVHRHRKVDWKRLVLAPLPVDDGESILFRESG